MTPYSSSDVIVFGFTSSHGSQKRLRTLLCMNNLRDSEDVTVLENDELARKYMDHIMAKIQ